ncbi:Lrp/AsnC family transcriptional regulator [Streptomyces sp. NPDC049954]|uniref:Lrp/AsnC family transcriptional regulator n=1 Tax=Streptomyces sp. NPDC049954 TaxID=3155779 RepID=UPI0034320F58
MVETRAPLSPLDRRIVGALQVDGRASWRRIASVLGEPERTVARRGTALLTSGAVSVVATAARGEAVVLRIRCSPGAARMVGAVLASRVDCTSCYLLTGTVHCHAEIFTPRSRLAALTLDEVNATRGLLEVDTHLVTRYYRGAHQWRPNLITRAQAEALAGGAQTTAPSTGASALPALSREDRIIRDALAVDGRTANEALARLAGVSESTAQRRVRGLLDTTRVNVRAVVDPALVGLPVCAMLWIRAHPRHVDDIGHALAASPYVRYAAATTGEFQLVADLAVPDTASLHEALTRSAWSEAVTAVQSALIVGAPKRSGVVHSPYEEEV